MYGAPRPFQNVVATSGIALNPVIVPANIKTFTDVSAMEDNTTPAPQMLSVPPAKPITILKSKNNAV